jgi:hypothetical protein
MKKKLNPQSILRIASKFERLVAEIDEEENDEQENDEQEFGKTLPIDDWHAMNKCTDSNDLFLEFRDSVADKLFSVRKKILEMVQDSYKEKLSGVNSAPVLHKLGKALEVASGKYHAGLLQRIDAIMALKFDESKEYGEFNVFGATRQLLNKIQVALPPNYGEGSRIDSMKKDIERAERFAVFAKPKLKDAQLSYMSSVKPIP